MSFKINSLYLTDGYKVSHQKMLAPGTTKLYGTWIPRGLKYAPKSISKIVSFGQQLVWKWIHDEFEENFFFTKERQHNFNYEMSGGTQASQMYNLKELKEKALSFVKDMSLYLGMEYDGKHFEELWDWGYLPIKVKALPEGIETNPNIPHMTFVNTIDGFAWLTLYLETIVSNLAWKPAYAATVAKLYRRQAEEWVAKTDPANMWLVDYMCHDFSARGLSGPHDMISVGLGHATSFRGSDTLVAIPAARYFYNEPENEVCINSVNASEHSVSTTKIFTVGEQQMIADWLEIFPKGILSMVSDTFDLWKLITEYLPANKEAIMARDGKLVIRPDCYSEDTLILTPDGWKEFNQLTPDSLVAQVNEDGSYTFVKPLKIVNEEYNGTMFHYKDFHGKMDLLVTPNHRMVYKQFNKWKVDFAEDCKPNNYTKFFIRSAKAENKYRGLTNVERLNIAFQADGSKCTDTDKNIRFNLSKVRKIQRLKALLDEMKLSYREYNLGDGRVEINIEYPLEQVSKNFDWVVTSDLCSNWCQEFIEELSYWDSCIRDENRIKFDTTNFSVSQVVELIALSAGYGCLTSKYEDDRKEIFSDVYTSHILLDNRLGGQAITVEEVQYDGRIVCVTVPTGKIVVKRNRCTMVCGNSGDPVDIICGTVIPEGKQYPKTPAGAGVIELLWGIFGGTINEQGYKVLDSHIGAIYGDSITPERQIQIYERLAAKGFASTNIVLGVGSFTYQYNTRDTLGFAAKGAWFEVQPKCECSETEAIECSKNTSDGSGKCNHKQSYNIYKDPITDDGHKRSLKGLLWVGNNGTQKHPEYYVVEEATPEQERRGLLQVIYEDGKFYNQTSLAEIRMRLK